MSENDILMLCDVNTSHKRYSGYYVNMVVPTSNKRLLGQERLNHDLKHGEVIYKYRNGDKSISEETYQKSLESLIADNIELAYKWAMDFIIKKKDFSKLYTLDMACSDALYALIKFIKNDYDYTMGYVVSTGAKMSIIRELQNCYNVAVFGNTSQRIIGYINDVRDYINSHEDCDVKTIASELRMRVDTVYSVLGLMRGTVELDSKISDEPCTSSDYYDILSKESLDNFKHRDSDRLKLNEMLSNLLDVERDIVLQKYRISNLKTKDVLHKYKITKSQYNDIYSQTMEKLQNEVKQNSL